MKLHTALAVASMSICTSVSAQTERDLDSHEHGSAALNVALDSNSVFIELETPWNNLVGFEHAPSTPEQQALVDDALALLNQPNELFSFGGADCQAVETLMENNLAESHDDEHHDDEHHDDAEKSHDDEPKDDHHDDDGGKSHDDEHKDDHHDEDGEKSHDDEHHDDHDGEHSDDEEAHSSVLVSYSFDCSNYKQLDTINVEILKIWPGFEELDVQMIGPGGQAALEISAEQPRIDVKSIR